MAETPKSRSKVLKPIADHWESIVIIVALIPMVFINLGSHHDWGGDFALYIQQAINLVHDVPQSETYYIFNPYYIYHSPPSYGVGFPLLLAPIYAAFGNDIHAFLTFISIALLLFLVLHFKFLRRRYHFIESFIITVVLAYTPRLLLLKGEVLSDIPFALFICLCLLLYSKYRTSRKPWLFVTIGLLVGFSMLIRSIGFLLIAAFFIDQIVLFFEAKDFGKKSITKFGVPLGALALSCLLVYVGLGIIAFPAKQETFSFFSELFFANPLQGQIREGLTYYFTLLEDVFNPEAEKWQFLGILLKSFVIVMLVVGLLNKLTKKPDFADYFFILYMVVVLIFPIYSQGIRYLLPVFPIASGYLITGFRSIQFERKINKNVVYLLICFSVYYAYEREVRKIDTYFPEQHTGPQTEEAKELFEFIRTKTHPNDIIVFTKPRVLGLYSRRNSYTLYPHGNLNTTRSQLWDLGWSYVLTCTELPDPPLLEFLEMRSEEIEEVFANEKFTLYRKK